MMVNGNPNICLNDHKDILRLVGKREDENSNDEFAVRKYSIAAVNTEHGCGYYCIIIIIIYNCDIFHYRQ